MDSFGLYRTRTLWLFRSHSFATIKRKWNLGLTEHIVEWGVEECILDLEDRTACGMCTVKSHGLQNRSSSKCLRTPYRNGGMRRGLTLAVLNLRILLSGCLFLIY